MWLELDISIDTYSQCNGIGGYADSDLKVQKFPYVKHGTVLSKHSHVIDMGIFK